MIAGDGIATVVEDQDLSPEVFRITQQGATILLQVDPEWQNGEFLLADITGKTCLKTILLNGTAQINVSHFSSAMYLAVIRKGEKEFVKKIFIR